MSEKKGQKDIIDNRNPKNLNKSKFDSDDENKKSAIETNDDEGASSSNSGFSLATLRQYLAEKLSLNNSDNDQYSDSSDHGSETKVTPLFSPLTFDSLIKHWKDKPYTNIITMVGAGISTSAGIPDFRSPKTGLYNNLKKYKLPHPQAIFELNYFRANPKPFFALAKELYPGSFKPTPCHYFVKLLEEKQYLLRHYTQNIDTLERIAGINEEKLVEAHGTFFSNHCLKCRKSYNMEYVKDKIFQEKIPKCSCGGVIKPDIVFFGENLPEKFYSLKDKDFKKCDLLIIMGTSLEVQPFASLINQVGENVPRLLINREIVGRPSFSFNSDEGLLLNQSHNTRDFDIIGDCDDGVQVIADRMGFGDELRELIKREHKKIDDTNKTSLPGIEKELDNLKL